MEAAKRGYLAYTNCTAALAEVVPFGGKYPTLGTNPHSWGFPTMESVGYPIVIDWATSTVAMGRVQQFRREGKQLPPNAAVDADGNPTTDPDKAVHLLPFGAHKGYGICMFTEIFAGAFTRGRCTHPENADAAKMINNMFSIYLDPEKLGGRENFDAEVERLVAWVKASPPADPALPVQVPGEFEANNRAARLRDGIPLDDNSWGQLTATAELVGLAPAEIETLAA
jgi:LDH2 family malate/lactate/ureidoglycolate dehydrogenase